MRPYRGELLATPANLLVPFIREGHVRACAEAEVALVVLHGGPSKRLLGFGWPLRHRVVPNAATERWSARDERGPRAARLVGWLSAPVGRVAPMEQMGRLAAMQRVGVPIFTPALPLSGTPAEALDRCALYAGESALRMDEVVPVRRSRSSDWRPDEASTPHGHADCVAS